MGNEWSIYQRFGREFIEDSITGNKPKGEDYIMILKAINMLLRLQDVVLHIHIVKKS